MTRREYGVILESRKKKFSQKDGKMRFIAFLGLYLLYYSSFKAIGDESYCFSFCENIVRKKELTKGESERFISGFQLSLTSNFTLTLVCFLKEGFLTKESCRMKNVF